jgi:hypothetical protein
MQWRALTIKAAMTRQVFRDEPSSLSIVRTCRSMAVVQGDRLRSEIELSGGSRRNEKFDAQSLLRPSLYCISDSTGSSPWDTT